MRFRMTGCPAGGGKRTTRGRSRRNKEKSLRALVALASSWPSLVCHWRTMRRRRQRQGEAPIEHARQPRASLFRPWRLLLRSRRGCAAGDTGAPATSATAVAASATARHTRVQVQLSRPHSGGDVAGWGMSLLDDDEELVRQYGHRPPHRTVALTLTLTLTLIPSVPWSCPDPLPHANPPQAASPFLLWLKVARRPRRAWRRPM